MSEKMWPEGCGYQGYEFGARYPDSICVGGWLFDADDCDEPGTLNEPMERFPCPNCNEDGIKSFPELIEQEPTDETE